MMLRQQQHQTTASMAATGITWHAARSASSRQRRIGMARPRIRRQNVGSNSIKYKATAAA